MPSSLLGDGDVRRRRIATLRMSGMAVAAVLGGIGVWLIVTGTSQKRIEIGVLTGLWGLLIGAYCAFGSRQPVPAPSPPPQFVPARLGPPDDENQPGGALDVRTRRPVQRVDDTAARREFQARLERLLRREVREGLARELAGLRAEVAALRSELVEKVGGELRLERIETTRVIGSDLEALQREVRKLTAQQPVEDAERAATQALASLRTAEDVEVVDESVAEAPVAEVPVAEVPVAEVPVAEVPVAEVPVAEPVPEPPVAEPVPERTVVPEPVPVAAHGRHAPLTVPPEFEPVSPVAVGRHEPRVAAPEPPPDHATEPLPALPTQVEAPAPNLTVSSDDLFATMPRLSPFRDDEGTEIAAPVTPPRRSGGRRYREDDSSDNVLARILQREGTPHG